MPQYNFFCRACNKEFSKIMTISEYEKNDAWAPKAAEKDDSHLEALTSEILLAPSYVHYCVTVARRTSPKNFAATL